MPWTILCEEITAWPSHNSVCSYKVMPCIERKARSQHASLQKPCMGHLWILQQEATACLSMNSMLSMCNLYWHSGIILCMSPVYERRRYIVTLSLIGWAIHIMSDIHKMNFGHCVFRNDRFQLVNLIKIDSNPMIWFLTMPVKIWYWSLKYLSFENQSIPFNIFSVFKWLNTSGVSTYISCSDTIYIFWWWYMYIHIYIYIYEAGIYQFRCQML